MKRAWISLSDACLQGLVLVATMGLLSAVCCAQEPTGQSRDEREELYRRWIETVTQPPYIAHSSLDTMVKQGLQAPGMSELLEKGPEIVPFLADKTSDAPSPFVRMMLIAACTRLTGRKFKTFEEFELWKVQKAWKTASTEKPLPTTSARPPKTPTVSPSARSPRAVPTATGKVLLPPASLKAKMQPKPTPASVRPPGLIPALAAGLGLLSLVLIVILFRRRRA